MATFQDFESNNLTYVCRLTHLFLKSLFYLSTDIAAEAKPTVGKDKEYKSPEYFGYDDMSFYDIEKSVVDQRVPQPKSGLTEYW